MAERASMLQGKKQQLLAQESRGIWTAARSEGRKETRNQAERSLQSVCRESDSSSEANRSNNLKGNQAPLPTRMVKTPAQGPPKRGKVTKRAVREIGLDVAAGVKKVIDTGKSFCCAPEPFDVDGFLEVLPSATTSEPMATLWGMVLV